MDQPTGTESTAAVVRGKGWRDYFVGPELYLRVMEIWWSWIKVIRNTEHVLSH